MRAIIESNVKVVMRDGAQLAADIYRPAAGADMPTLLHRTPYGRDGATASYAIDPLRAVREGMAVVIVDLRGRHDSHGEFHPFAADIDDLIGLLDWLHGQRWSGQIGLVGGSYSGTLQWLAAGAVPDRIRAICPYMCSPDFSTWTWRDGLLQQGFLATWGLTNLVAPADAIHRGSLLSLATEVLTAPPDEDRRAQLAAEVPWYGLWRSASPETVPAASTVPALVVTGWFDVFKDQALTAFAEASSDRPGEHALIVGPWSHSNTTGYFAERSFGHEASAVAVDVVGRQLSWLRSHLGGDGTDGQPVVLVYLMGRDVWQVTESWPPEATSVSLWLAGSEVAGTLADEPSGRAGAFVISHDPSSPARTIGGAVYLPGARIALSAGPMEQPLASTPHLLGLVSARLAQEMTVCGRVSIVLYVEVDTDEFDLAVTLLDVFPDGTAFNLTRGARRFGGRDAGASGAQRVEVDLGAVGNHFGAGHQIGLLIAASDFPATEPRPTPYTVTLRTGQATPSELVLPVVRPQAMCNLETWRTG